MLANAIGIRGEKGKGKKTNHISTCSHKRVLNTVESYALVFFDTMQVIRLCSVLLSWIIKRKLVRSRRFPQCNVVRENILYKILWKTCHARSVNAPVGGGPARVQLRYLSEAADL